MLFSLASFLILFPLGLYQYTIIPFAIFCILLLLFRMWFYHRCRKYIDLNKDIISIENFIQGNDKNEGYIRFNSENNSYSCVCNDSIIRFNLKGFILKKSFIRAFIVRQIRYKAVSNKLKIAKLFSLKLKSNFKYNKLYLIINIHTYLILMNGISINTIFSSEISNSNFAALYSSLRTFMAGNVIIDINEKIYSDYYKAYSRF
jgi:hypothetical protein